MKPSNIPLTIILLTVVGCSSIPIDKGPAPTSMGTSEQISFASPASSWRDFEKTQG